MTFQRARTDEQRDQRRRQILDTAAAMLAEMPVSKVSLNELSRRTGLAKANVLRYFESREAILLQLLDAELTQWITALEDSLAPAEGTPRARGDRLAQALAESATGRPVLCDLISAQAGVLEHNVSTDVAVWHKHATLRHFQSLVHLIRRHLPELGTQDAFRFVGLLTLTVAAAWPYHQPPKALLDAYTAEPTLAGLQADFTDVVRQSTEITLSGLLARAEDAPLGPGPLDARPAQA
ncbi:TetR/AcrR family transcriptional regulator [Streptomyces sp. NPDC059894]|uniref:TetR/AcrR family transcriptional regulator n=1 Tax=unclassified Streptomyces TaxID=2593676 RepID=UPI0036664B90